MLSAKFPKAHVVILGFVGIYFEKALRRCCWFVILSNLFRKTNSGRDDMLVEEATAPVFRERIQRCRLHMQFEKQRFSATQHSHYFQKRCLKFEDSFSYALLIRFE